MKYEHRSRLLWATRFITASVIATILTASVVPAATRVTPSSSESSQIEDQKGNWRNLKIRPRSAEPFEITRAEAGRIPEEGGERLQIRLTVVNRSTEAIRAAEVKLAGGNEWPLMLQVPLRSLLPPGETISFSMSQEHRDLFDETKLDEVMVEPGAVLREDGTMWSPKDLGITKKPQQVKTFVDPSKPSSENALVADRPLPESGAETPLRVGGDVKAPRVLHRVEPLYTPEARRSRIQGIAIVEAIIDRKGDVQDVRVLKGLPAGLSEAAADAVRQWKFEPGTLHGDPVDVIFALTVSFRLIEPDPGASASSSIVSAASPSRCVLTVSGVGETYEFSCRVTGRVGSPPDQYEAYVTVTAVLTREVVSTARIKFSASEPARAFWGRARNGALATGIRISLVASDDGVITFTGEVLKEGSVAGTGSTSCSAH